MKTETNHEEGEHRVSPTIEKEKIPGEAFLKNGFERFKARKAHKKHLLQEAMREIGLLGNKKFDAAFYVFRTVILLVCWWGLVLFFATFIFLVFFSWLTGTHLNGVPHN